VVAAALLSPIPLRCLVSFALLLDDQQVVRLRHLPGKSLSRQSLSRLLKGHTIGYKE